MRSDKNLIRHSPASLWLSCVLQFLKFFPEPGEGFLHTLRILDLHSRHLQSGKGKAHGEAMVIMSIQLSAVERSRGDLDPVTTHGDVRPQLCQLFRQRGQPV